MYGPHWHQGIRMKRAWVLIAFLGLWASPAFGRMPEINVKALCKARDNDAKMFRSTTGQSVDECVQDEEKAKQLLNTLWTSTSASLRNECVREARMLGTMSYLDLVTCIQMAEEMKDDLKPSPKKKASK
jgi:hypothetical protein